MPTTRILATAVFVSAPKTRETLLLEPGTEVSDPAIAAQITHPDAWLSQTRRRSRITRAESS
ncbi:hypothetical protein [Streptomyces aurantiogriseus]|uniref:Uncharacterized protein n=1 Tax=Streptomyces aurantiogriseus TaxID=66870 RepID=A0A918F3X9_9ACTN|nr:hypothetical protein [Streptomyces aurantiogriseus]GGR06258.1 hypothetical protein GCM10010251_22510 [Streptomyces aurantiogriseus]